MRYIFVDFDGVLNTEKYQNDLRHKGLKTCDNYGPIFDPSAVECLCDIVSQVPDASIVIISSWKFEGEERMFQLWKDRNLPGVLSGITPTFILVYMSVFTAFPFSSKIKTLLFFINLPYPLL